MSDLERRAEELANEALAQHWDSGNYPAGPGISDSFRKNVGYAKDLAAIVLQLLSENRQVRETSERLRRSTKAAAGAWAEEVASDPNFDYVVSLETDLSSAQSTIAQLKEDLDRISAEREAYRTFIEEVKDWDDSMDVLEARARRILAENDR